MKLIAAWIALVLKWSPVSAPATILANQNLNVWQGLCEANWDRLLEKPVVQPIALGGSTQLWIVPCSFWADNIGYTVFLTVGEKSHPDGFVTKPIYFLRYFSAEKRVNADNVLYNVSWEPETNQLVSRFYLNGHRNCGSLAHYVWNSNSQNFEVRAMQVNDNCQEVSGKWKSISL